MNSEGGDTPKDDSSPPHTSGVTPPPGHAVAQRPPPPSGAGNPPQTQGNPEQPAAQQKSRIPQDRKRGKFSRRNIAIANGRSKNRLFAVIHPLHLAVILFSFIAIAMMAAALGTDYWYVVTDGTNLLRVGLFNQCIGSSSCDSISFADTSNSICSRSGSDKKQVNNIVIGLSIAGIVLSFLALVFSAISRSVAQAITSWVVLAFSLLATGAYAAGVGQFAYNKEHWEFCGTDFCSYIKNLTGTTNGCDASYGFSLGLAAIAIGSGFLAMVFAIFRIVFREWNIVDDAAPPAIATEELAPQNRPRTTAAVEPGQREPYGDVSDAEMADAAEKIPPPPEGDWVYDAECGMYWSENEFLFLDPYTQHSYDPNSDMWYDPETEEWYQGEQIDPQ